MVSDSFTEIEVDISQYQRFIHLHTPANELGICGQYQLSARARLEICAL
jgi:hypothetical protein